MTLFKTKPELFGTGPVIPVHDIQATVDFYCDVLGFDLDILARPVTGLLHGSGVLAAKHSNDPTVLDDLAKDRLEGGDGRDWFFAKLFAPEKAKLSDSEANEIIDVL